MREWVESIVERVKPLETAVNRAWWDAAVTGFQADYQHLESLRNDLDDILRDPSLAERLARARAESPEDPLLARAIELLWLEVMPRQVDASLSERMNRLATEIERDFSIYRPQFEGRETSQNDLDDILTHETDETRLREAWEAGKSVGPRLAARMRELVDLRNTAARAVGYDDFWHLKLALYEQDPASVEAIFDRLDAMTEEPFRALKGEIDERLAARLDVEPDALRPWHYQDFYFQEAPAVFGVDLDGCYRTVDPLDVARRFFDGIGLAVASILERSSLYEGPGKDPHAFATDIDREGDVRILLNLRRNERWMGTTLHELGHAVYDEGIDRGLSWLLRRPAHTVTTEAMAMLAGRLSKSADWMRDMGVVGIAEADALREPAARELRAHMLVFSRWAQVMMRFERTLYAEPDQDLNGLWWSLVERYQEVERPERPADAADWATKIHVVAAPVYYHNYLLGECFASQIDAALRTEVLEDEATYCGNEDVGAWLSERVFRPGARWHYDELARRATGSPVAPEAFADQFLAEVSP